MRYRVNLEHGARRILERIVEAESGDQTIKGRQMVANVILNRMKSEKFPNSVREIVLPAVSSRRCQTAATTA